MMTNATPRDSTPKTAVANADSGARRSLVILFCATLALLAMLIIFRHHDAYPVLEWVCLMLRLFGSR
jgi:hypothetical protein